MTMLIVLVRPRDDLSLDDFRAHLHGTHANLVARLPVLRRPMFKDVLPLRVPATTTPFTSRSTRPLNGLTVTEQPQDSRRCQT
jgi:hypothetical protein